MRGAVGNLLDRVLLLAADFRFLQGELERTQKALTVSEAEQMRADLLAVIGKSGLVAQATRVLLPSLAATVVLEEVTDEKEAAETRIAPRVAMCYQADACTNYSLTSASVPPKLM